MTCLACRFRLRSKRFLPLWAHIRKCRFSDEVRDTSQTFHFRGTITSTIHGLRVKEFIRMSSSGTKAAMGRVLLICADSSTIQQVAEGMQQFGTRSPFSF